MPQRPRVEAPRERNRRWSRRGRSQESRLATRRLRRCYLAARGGNHARLSRPSFRDTAPHLPPATSPPTSTGRARHPIGRNVTRYMAHGKVRHRGRTGRSAAWKACAPAQPTTGRRNDCEGGGGSSQRQDMGWSRTNPPNTPETWLLCGKSGVNSCGLVLAIDHVGSCQFFAEISRLGSGARSNK